MNDIGKYLANTICDLGVLTIFSLAPEVQQAINSVLTALIIICGNLIIHFIKYLIKKIKKKEKDEHLEDIEIDNEGNEVKKEDKK